MKDKRGMKYRYCEHLSKETRGMAVWFCGVCRMYMCWDCVGRHGGHGEPSKGRRWTWTPKEEE